MHLTRYQTLTFVSLWSTIRLSGYGTSTRMTAEGTLSVTARLSSRATTTRPTRPQRLQDEAAPFTAVPGACIRRPSIEIALRFWTWTWIPPRYGVQCGNGGLRP